jgi:hypothetical protein
MGNGWSAARYRPRRSDANGAGDHDRDRLSWRGRYRAGRTYRTRVDDGGFHVMEKGGRLEYRMTACTMDSCNIEKLSKTLPGLASIVEFNISIAGE